VSFLAADLAFDGTIGLIDEYKQAKCRVADGGVPSDIDAVPAALESGMQDYGATMAEVTDSFCERCGARYDFAASAPKGPALKSARVLARGLKNFLITDAQSIGDALALARQEDGRQDSSRLTEAFRRTFNFCLTCRQYACDRCWNPTAAACLSCAPDSDLAVVAPEDHSIVRTPGARSDANWSAFLGGPAPEAVADPAHQAHFDHAVHPGEPGSQRQLHASAFPAWPAADLPAGPTSAAAGPTKTARIASTKPTDGETWSLWPIADEIAPEMTLTPEEMALIEARLGHGETRRDPAADLVAAPEPLLRDELPAPLAPQHTLADDVAGPADLTSGSVDRVILFNAAREPDAAVTDNGPAPAAPSADRREPPEPEVADRHGHILRNPMATLPPLSSLATPQPNTRKHIPIVARLLGRLASPQPEAAASAQHGPAPAPSGEPDGDPWPRPTKWLDRPVRTHDRWRETDASAENVKPEELAPSSGPVPAPALPAEAPEPVPEPAHRIDAPEPMTQPLEPSQIDGRYAAAVRLSAACAAAIGPVGAADRVDQAARSESQPDPEMASLWAAAPAAPVGGSPLSDQAPEGPAERGAAAPEPPALLEVDQDLVEALRRERAEALDRNRVGRTAPAAETLQVPPGSSSPAATPSSPWPPLGASWPAQENPGAPWPGPQPPEVPAVVAARQAGTPMLAEMWAQSAEQVLNRGSVRVCHGCALPVSTQARYCRRCGTHQA
jgi:hypothetical protein